MYARYRCRSREFTGSFHYPEERGAERRKGVREKEGKEVGEGKMSKEWAEGSLGAALSEREDVRREHLRVHDLVPVLLVSVAAMISGMKSLYAIGQWARERREDQPELLEELGFPPGRTPSVATLHRVFRTLKVQAFEAILGNWLRGSGARAKEPIALDGKTLRGIHGEEIPGVHLVSAFTLTTSTVLYQQATQGKGGELATVKEVLKEVLKEVPLTGRVVMTDALSTQREVCQQIRDAGGHYFVPVKGNQPTLLNDLQEAFSPSEAGDGPSVGRGAGGIP
jgi:hypothetical protein